MTTRATRELAEEARGFGGGDGIIADRLAPCGQGLAGLGKVLSNGDGHRSGSLVERRLLPVLYTIVCRISSAVSLRAPDCDLKAMARDNAETLAKP